MPTPEIAGNVVETLCCAFFVFLYLLYLFFSFSLFTLADSICR